MRICIVWVKESESIPPHKWMITGLQHQDLLGASQVPAFCPSWQWYGLMVVTGQPEHTGLTIMGATAKKNKNTHAFKTGWNNCDTIKTTSQTGSENTANGFPSNLLIWDVYLLAIQSTLGKFAHPCKHLASTPTLIRSQHQARFASPHTLCLVRLRFHATHL